MWHAGDDAQLLLYDLTTPLPASRPASTRPGSSKPASTRPKPSANPSATSSSHLTKPRHPHSILSPTASPHLPISRDPSPAAQLPESAAGLESSVTLSGKGQVDGDGAGGAGTGSGAGEAAMEIMPARGWTAEAGINNLCWDGKGEWLGCVSGNRLSVLRV